MAKLLLDKRRFLRLMVLPPSFPFPPSSPNEYTLKMCTKGNLKIDAGRRSIDPILDSLKREAHFRREITRELAIWPLHTCEGRVSGRGRGSCADPARSLDNGNNKEGQESGFYVGSRFVKGEFLL